MRIHIDFETRASVDIKKTGGWRYTHHPMTTILCMAWAIVSGNTPAEQADVKLWLPDEPFPTELRAAIEDRQNLVVAHNAIFERAVFANIGIPRFGFPTVEAHQWRCTLAKAAMHGLPKGLSECGRALGLKVVKDDAGKRVMLKLSKYTDKVSKNNPMGMHEKPEDYQTLYAYCIQDVYSEIAIDHALRDLPEREQQVWHLDQKMNIAGVHVDRQSASIIVGQIEQLNDRLMLELAQLTKGEVTSVKQSAKLKTWLSRESGAILSSVDKEAIDQLLSHKELPSHVKRVAEIRQALGRSSVSKYQAILNTTTDHDPYVRDFLQYHSASTGRWGGRIVQFQNVPRGDIKDMDAAIANITEMGLEGIEMWYDNPMGLYAGAIRGMVCAPQGFDLAVADYNAIEPRVLFWLSDDPKGLEIYRTHEKIYEYMAADIYGTTPDAIGKDSMERFLGKTAVLGCFGANTRVLTSNGIKRIVDVLVTDMVWDGHEWVHHQGVKYQGIKTVISLRGVLTTPEHMWLTQEGWESAFQVLKRGLRYQKLAARLANLRYVPTKLAAEAVFAALTLRVAVAARTFTQWTCIILGRVGSLRATHALKPTARRHAKDITGTRASSRNQCTENASLIESPHVSQDAIIQKIEFTRTMAGEEYMCTPRGEKIKKSFSVISSLCRVGTNLYAKLIGLTTTKGMSLITFGFARGRRTLKIYAGLETLKRQLKRYALKTLNFETRSRVYDLVNSGPRNRFCVITTLGPMVVHNCGYSLGAQKFMESCHKQGAYIDIDLAERAVKQYRQTFEGVPRLWYHVEDCARHAIKHEGAVVPCANGKIYWMKQGDFLYAKLPAGRFLAYHKPKVVMREKWGQMRETITYWGVRSTDMGAPKYCEVETYGARLVENSVQAISRDIMADAMLRLDASKKYTPVLSVHDEAISTVAEGTGDVQEYCDLLTQKEPWAKDIPLKAAGWIGKRYRK